MRTFRIRYYELDLEVREEKEHCFSVDLPERKLCLLLKQDNEGANHWFEDGTDKETGESQSVGLAIERYLNRE